MAPSEARSTARIAPPMPSHTASGVWSRICTEVAVVVAVTVEGVGVVRLGERGVKASGESQQAAEGPQQKEPSLQDVTATVPLDEPFYILSAFPSLPLARITTYPHGTRRASCREGG